MADEKKWVLLVDDDVEFGRVLEIYLKKLGISLVTTLSPEPFFETLKKNLPTVCMVDLNLSGVLAGFALVKVLRKKFGADLPVWIVSADNDPKTVAHAIEIGANDYILKPVDRTVLKTKLSSYITSEQLDEDKVEYVEALDRGVPAKIAVGARLRIIDELGATLVGPHLLCKSSPVTLSGPFFEEVFSTQRGILTSVVSSGFDSATEQYQTVVEFSELSSEAQTSLRKYLLSKQKTPEASPKKA